MKKLKVLVFMKTLLLSSCFLLLFQSCQEEDYLEIKNGTSIKLNHNDYYTIKAESLTRIDYSIEDEYVARKHNYYKDPTICANYVGSTRIILHNESGIEKYVNVKVVPESYLYPEPNLFFGDTKYDVKSKLGIPNQEKTNAFLYTDYSNNAPYLLVTFEYGQVSSYAVLVKYDYYRELTDRFLAERYKYMGYVGTIRTYIDALTLPESKKTIAVEYYESANYNYYAPYYMVGYLNTSNTRNPIDINCLKTTLSTML